MPGLHHSNEHYGRVWSGDDWLDNPWLEGHAAIDAIINCVPGPSPPVAGKQDKSPRKTRRTTLEKDPDTKNKTASARKNRFKSTRQSHDLFGFGWRIG